MTTAAIVNIKNEIIDTNQNTTLYSQGTHATISHIQINIALDGDIHMVK